MIEYKAKKVEDDSFPVCECGCATYGYEGGGRFVPSFNLETDAGAVSSVIIGHHRCAGCQLNSLVVACYDIDGVFDTWLLPVGKDIEDE